MRVSVTPLVLVACLTVSRCGCERDRAPLPTPHDSGADPAADPLPDPTSDPPDADAPADAVDDTAGDDDAGPEAAPPPCPPDGVVGRPCSSDGDCEGDASCVVERTQDYEGHTYRTWQDGYCVDGSWGAGCDPRLPGSCPPGARCVHLGTILCEDRWACLDACTSTDSAGDPYDFNACCRPGYACDPLVDVCVPGCSNHRECCESWSDLDGDTLREAAEVELSEGCTQTCDPDLRRCTGSTGRPWTSGCTIDAHCPEGGVCVAEGCHSILGPPAAGGLCVGPACETDPGWCTASGGGCVAAPAGGLAGNVCLAACFTGHEPGDPAGGCRAGMACWPVCEPGWVGPAPAGGEDGTCMAPRGTSAAGDTLYGPCSADDECGSPLGLGVCIHRDVGGVCSAACNGPLASESHVCGAAPAPGEPPPGLCWQCRCRMACSDPSLPLSASPCDVAGELACYPLSSLWSEASWSDGAAEPAGLCLPACSTAGDCEALWGIAYDCDDVTGRCTL
jgi:hypothetical protein